ncbi:sigma-54 interaction domain-containing protein [Thioalkalivibrio sulfidiphilus]|uniref:sigma-54 interaction domain-containing protein n=1 Tax=Thioalkalivibrio sulfidiphilus TaxID=1033854 RepID=UPI00037015CB|nr:sigma-54-dependent Fis family transcriptional regulator [Thioalkalivibrio sulfidiphilus]
MSSPAPLSPELLGLLDSHDEPAVLLDPDYRILAANSAYRRVYGEAGRGRKCFQVSHGYTVPCDQAGESCPLKGCLETGQAQRVLHLHQTPRGEEHVDVETRPIPRADGRVHYVLEIMRQSKVASARPSAEKLVGRSPAFNHMLGLVQRVAPSEATVLLLGETGTGKELVAQAIHELSPRHTGPFVAVECAGLTETLFESELFGHERGAFTGATSMKVGLVEAARGGTLFLDELGDIPLGMQVKLLRLLETGTFRRVGGIEPQKADFRLVCATHRDLEALVRAGEFREDLFYRISVFPIQLPALRERREDLAVLAEALLARIPSARGKRLGRDALAALRDYPFPGNIRELRNLLERASLLADDREIEARHLALGPHPARQENLCPESGEIIPLDELEGRYLRRVSARYRGERRELARLLGVSERTLYRKLEGLREGRDHGQD